MYTNLLNASDFAEALNQRHDALLIQSIRMDMTMERVDDCRVCQKIIEFLS